jgi:hypothetical protein
MTESQPDPALDVCCTVCGAQAGEPCAEVLRGWICARPKAHLIRLRDAVRESRQ